MKSSLKSIPARLRPLYRLAVKSRLNSYSPYSGHRVGAAIRTSDGSLFGGCNVENSSYGGTVCAERVAIQKAVSEGKTRVTEVLVVTDATPPWPPCGMCRQVIAEFAENAVIHTTNLKGMIETSRLEDIMPRAFTPSHLGKK